jgi:protein involved in ribonucleotide reduction
MAHPEGDWLVAARIVEARPKRVRRFLNDHREKLRGVARREATKYLKA